MRPSRTCFRSSKRKGVWVSEVTYRAIVSQANPRRLGLGGAEQRPPSASAINLQPDRQGPDLHDFAEPARPAALRAARPARLPRQRIKCHPPSISTPLASSRALCFGPTS